MTQPSDDAGNAGTRRNDATRHGARDTAPVHLLAALALELTPGSEVARDALPQAGAAALAERIAGDLATFAPEASSLELVTVGAHYDPVELLRPGWPLHRELEQLAARAPAGATPPGAGRVIAFGSHDGRLPGTLAPAPAHAGGPLRLVPVLLGVAAADGGALARLGDRFERELMERGMAGAATALLAQEAFGVRVEHARYLTVHDLLAMTALQYEHAGIAPLWPIVETALLAPSDDCVLDAPPEPLVAYAGGHARIAWLDPVAWCRRHAPGADHDDPAVRERLAALHRGFEARQRQFAEVLMAHGIPVTLEHRPDGPGHGLG